MARLCPDCRQPLNSIPFLSVNLDACPICGGIWFDEGELVKLHEAGKTVSLRSLESRIEPRMAALNDNDRDRLCPICNTRLTRYRYLYDSEVYLHECDDCMGVWMQDGELEKIAAVLDARAFNPDDQEVADMNVLSDELRAVMPVHQNRAKGAVAFWSMVAEHRRRI